MARPTNALIVDDEAHVRVYVRLLLKKLGIETVWEAADGAQALAKIAEHRPELVMLDINLPQMSGMDVLAKLQTERFRPPVIMMSSLSSLKIVTECVKLGALAYVLKHSPQAQALKTLAEALAQLDDSGDTDEEPVAQ